MKKCTFIANLIPLLTLLIVMSSSISSATYANCEKVGVNWSKQISNILDQTVANNADDSQSNNNYH